MHTLWAWESLVSIEAAITWTEMQLHPATITLTQYSAPVLPMFNSPKIVALKQVRVQCHFLLFLPRSYSHIFRLPCWWERTFIVRFTLSIPFISSAPLRSAALRSAAPWSPWVAVCLWSPTVGCPCGASLAGPASGFWLGSEWSDRPPVEPWTFLQTSWAPHALRSAPPPCDVHTYSHMVDHTFTKYHINAAIYYI